MKPKCYKSATLLGRDWLDREIFGGDYTWQIGKNFISSNENAIWMWNENIPQVLVRRHQHFPLVIGIRFSFPALGKTAAAAIEAALEIPENAKHYWCADGVIRKAVYSEASSPIPFTYVNNLQDEQLSLCAMETLHPLVLKTSAEALNLLIRGYKKYGLKDMNYHELEDSWERENKILQAVGLTMPKEYEDQKVVAIATRRLRTGIYHE